MRQALQTLGFLLQDPPSQWVDLVGGTVGGVPLASCAYRAAAGSDWSCLHLPGGSNWGETLAGALTHQTGQPALVLTEHDQQTWEFSVHSLTHPVQRFHSHSQSRPGGPLPADSHAGLADLLGLDPDQFEGYLEPVPADTDPEERVFPDDLFPRLNPWVRVDFLRAIGIEYPIPAQTASGVFCLLVPPGSTTVNRLGIPQPGDPIPPIDPSLLRLN